MSLVPAHPTRLVGPQLGFSTVDSPRLTFSLVYPERPCRVSCLSGSTPTRFPAHAPLLRSLWSRMPFSHLSVSLLPLTFLQVHLFLSLCLFPAPSGTPSSASRSSSLPLPARLSLAGPRQAGRRLRSWPSAASTLPGGGGLSSARQSESAASPAAPSC